MDNSETPLSHENPIPDLYLRASMINLCGNALGFLSERNPDNPIRRLGNALLSIGIERYVQIKDNYDGTRADDDSFSLDVVSVIKKGQDPLTAIRTTAIEYYEEPYDKVYGHVVVEGVLMLLLAKMDSVIATSRKTFTGELKLGAWYILSSTLIRLLTIETR